MPALPKISHGCYARLQLRPFGVSFLPDASPAISIRNTTPADTEILWSMLRPVFRAGETYGVDPAITREAALHLWLEAPEATFAATDGQRLLGTYFLRPNGAGPTGHVCNCGYIVAEEARGRGIAQRLCEHSQEIARKRGYRAMQFNSVAASNEVAVRLWQRLGFSIVGRVPQGFNHPEQGLVDLWVMYKWLG